MKRRLGTNLMTVFVAGLLIAGSPSQAIAAPTVPEFTVMEFFSIQLPRGVTFDGTGNLYTLERDAGTVFKITPTGDVSECNTLPPEPVGYNGPHFDLVSGNLFVSRFANGMGSEVFKFTCDSDVELVNTEIEIVRPGSLTTDAAGNLYVSQFICPGVVFQITPMGDVSPFADGLCFPDGLAFGPSGDLFIGDRGTNRVMRVPPIGGTATEFASGFNNPIALTFDQEGDLLVANFDDDTIVEVSPEGIVSPFGSGFIQPDGLAFDRSGNLFVADFGANLIYKVTPIDTVSVGGSVTGISPGFMFVLCFNKTTEQLVPIFLEGATSWDCEAAGLLVNPGDIVRMRMFVSGQAN